MNILKSINLYPAKRVKPYPVEAVNVVAKGGLEGDFRCNSEKKQISITDQVVLDWMKAQEEPGLCFQKFSANLVVDQLNYDQFQSGSVLSINNASIEIQKVGKHCFGEECVYCQKGIDCILIKGILFGCGKEGGCIQQGAEVEVKE